MNDENVELSVVMPCLNESDTVGICIEKAQRATRRFAAKSFWPTTVARTTRSKLPSRSVLASSMFPNPATVRR